jgi:hypothetical protein
MIRLASIVLISLLTRRTMLSSTKCLSRWRKHLASDRNRACLFPLCLYCTFPLSTPSCSLQCRNYSLSCSGFMVLFFVQCNPLLTKLSFFYKPTTNFQFFSGLGSIGHRTLRIMTTCSDLITRPILLPSRCLMLNESSRCKLWFLVSVYLAILSAPYTYPDSAPPHSLTYVFIVACSITGIAEHIRL